MFNLSFKSTIRPTSIQEYNITTPKDKKYYVAHPWTVKETVFAEKAYTKNVLDCVVCGITDGAKVLLLHICPTHENNQDFSKIAKYIKEKIDLTNPDLQAILVGGQSPEKADKRSFVLWDNFTKLLNDFKIPFSELKGGRGEKHVSYSSLNDEWVIASDSYDNNAQSANESLNKMFDKVVLSEEDELC